MTAAETAVGITLVWIGLGAMYLTTVLVLDIIVWRKEDDDGSEE